MKHTFYRPVQDLQLARGFLLAALLGLVATLAGSIGVGSASTLQTSASLPSNTSLPTLLGTAKRGATIAASTGSWSGSQPIVFTYQWQRCDANGQNCVDVGGASDPIRTLAGDAVGHTVRVVVTASNPAGIVRAVSSVSPVVTAVSDSAPRDTTAPRITGDARTGQRLRVRNGVWRGSAPIQFTYGWQRCDTTGANCVVIAGETGSRYVLTATDVNNTIRAIVTAANSNGTNTAVTEQTMLIAGLRAPANTVAPSITGSTRTGEKLTAHAGSWTGSATINFAFQWQRCDAGGGACVATGGATASQYRTTSADAGRRIRVLVTARNAAGSAALLSDATGVIQSLSSPVATSAPRISGVARQGNVLTVVRGSWSGSTPITFTFQWLRCDAAGNSCANIPNSTGPSYRVSVGDVNHTVRVAATASNSVGRSTIFSGRTALVSPSAPINTVQPTIAGAATQGSTLTANPGSWNSFTPITYSYQWTRCNAAGQACTPIPGHIGIGQRTYTLTPADVGHRIFVQIKASNSLGPTFVNSPQTVAVSSAGGTTPPPPTTGNAVPVTSVSSPDRLLIDKVQFTPNRIRSNAEPLTARIHVIETSGHRAVSGALVYAVGVPFDRLSGRGELITGPNGWATITFQVLPTFQLRHGNLVVVFVRARKPGENPLGGISTRRLVSVRVA